MTEREAFIEAIATNPDEDTPRLVFADWLQEHGEERRAEFVRIQCALARRPHDWNDPDGDRSINLFARHLPEWFGELFAAVGMPQPTPTHRVGSAWGRWRYGPYSFVHMWGRNDGAGGYGWEEESHSAKAGLLVRFAGEEEDPPVPRPSWLLSYLGFDRGFVTDLHVVPAAGTVWGPLARAFRLEPIHQLAVELDPQPDHWLALSDPCLRRVRSLQVRLATGGPVPDCSEAVEAVLGDPTLGGVRELVLEGADPRPLSARDQEEWAQRIAPPELIERMLQTEVANAVARLRLCIGREGVLTFAAGAALTGLRTLELGPNDLGPSDRVALNQYRDRLEELSLAGNTNDPGPLLTGPPWSRLVKLTLPAAEFGVPEIAALARADLFPTLARLNFTGYPALTESAAHLAEVIRSGGFACLTHLGLSGYGVSDADALALAAAVAPTPLRELDLRFNYAISDDAKEAIGKTLGDRVRLDAPGGNNPIPF
jgi:uncharacterized protein (TIGR02996 family)